MKPLARLEVIEFLIRKSMRTRTRMPGVTGLDRYEKLLHKRKYISLAAATESTGSVNGIHKTTASTMGAASSHFADTDWEKADGGLRDPSQTLDGQPPTEAHSILTLKKQTLVNQREFTITDDIDDLLYRSKAIEGTTKNFLLLNPEGGPIFCVHTDKAHAEWTIYSFKPNWEGQEAATPEGLYRKARIDITWHKNHGEVRLHSPNDTDPKGDIDISTSQPLLVCEEIRSITAQFQSYVPFKASENVLIPPVAGWWVWEHTPRSHQLKMHLAKGNDVALHCIVAITCNMVQVEKQADNSL